MNLYPFWARPPNDPLFAQNLRLGVTNNFYFLLDSVLRFVVSRGRLNFQISALHHIKMAARQGSRMIERGVIIQGFTN